MEDIYENFKEKVREQADIVKIVSDYIPLKKKGGRFWGCCPFHGEKTASFTVTPDKNLFHCFGCHAGGDVFSFIMKIENVSFPEATKILANKLGIPIPERHKTDQELMKERIAKQVFDTNAMAVLFFQACLLKTEYGKIALEYLAKRGITLDIIEKFSIGLAPPSFDTLQKALNNKGIAKELLLKAGLVNKRNSGGVYDKFRERIMIPIKDARGRVVGFGGRIITNGEPKYLNTGETEWFIKRNLLFGLDISLKAIKEHKQVIVVEGYMDAISLHAAGVTWAVASLGTAFSVSHANIIKKIAPEVIFSFDSDRAGIKAAMSAVSIAQKANLSSRVLVVKEGKDPDEFIRRFGKEAFLKLVETAIPGIDFLIDQTIKEKNITNLAGKVEVVSNILPFLLDCKNDIEVGQYIRNLARTLTIDEGMILSEYRKMRGKHQATDIVIKTPRRNELSISPVTQAERQLLFAIINNPEVARKDLTKLNNVILVDDTRRIILEEAKKLVISGQENLRDILFSCLQEDACAELAEILQQDLSIDVAKEIINGCLKQLKIASLELEFEKHSKQAVEYEKTGNNLFLQELTQCQHIKNEIRNTLNEE